MDAKKLADNFWWVGTLDPDLRIFDIVMSTECGTTYNSYLLTGEKNVLFEVSKEPFTDEYIKTVESVIPVSDINALIISHTEPDHTGALERILELNPDIEIYATMGGLNFIKEIVNRGFNGVCVKDGDEVNIGGNVLRFIVAPNLHWPDTMFTYIPEKKTLVTCDAFGAHYSYDGIVNDDKLDKEMYLKEARYYFDGIMSPFKADVLKAINKIDGLEIDMIATGHGPVLTENPKNMVGLYREWALEPDRNEKKTVIIPYVSAYGNTKLLAETIAEGIRKAGDIDVKLFDMVYEDIGDVMQEIKMADGFLLGTPTLVGEALPPIWNITSLLNARIHGGKYAGVFGSYGWSGEAVPNVLGRLKQLKLKLVGEGFHIRFKPNEEELTDAFNYGLTFGTAVLTDKLPE